MKTIQEHLKYALRVEKILKNSESYLAHLPPMHSHFKNETLSEHLNLVFQYSEKIVSNNSLDQVLNNLIEQVVLHQNANSDFIQDYIKKLFVDTIVFHDFGKVNENFQVDRMKNSCFNNVKTIINPAHGHSDLGTFIFLVYNLEHINKLEILDEDEKVFLSYITFALANSITLHHSPKLIEPFGKLSSRVYIEEYAKLTKYLDIYGFNFSEISQSYFENLKEINESIDLDNGQLFPLYALTRLNFSLLTASDYLATSEYMNQQPINSLGLIDSDLREKVIFAAVNSHSYNSDAYSLSISDYKSENPLEKSGENLNLVRKNMAVELLRNIKINTHQNLFYLEAPTGGGKTNLSMLAIAELLKENEIINKVFYVFPFTTLITQTHKAILKTLNLSENEVSLLHSKAGFQSNVDPNTEENEDGKYGQEKKDFISNLFVHYPFCLLTHIRFFDILKTNEKETNYLFHRLANSIVVIDELQSYSPVHWDKMMYFIQNYAKTFNVKFILMSATLPKIDNLKFLLENRPSFTDLLPDAKQYFTNPNFSERVTFRFDYRDSTLEMAELAEIVIEKSQEYLEANKESGVFTIIEFIFKKSATEFEEAIDSRFFDEILVLSGTILEPRRKEIINKLKNLKSRDKKILLITTQVVEAGVDIDMDLGFKNVSLIDSDEQLAGRVNRNVKKKNCEVYLFQINKPGILYKNDRRYAVTRDKISSAEHEEILRTKNFEKLYDLVFERIDKQNKMEGIDNFNTYHDYIKKLDFQNVHDKFKLIENRNLSIFVPLSLPISIENEEGKSEEIFSQNELTFLEKNNIYHEDGLLNGILVWDLYLKMNNNELIFKEYTDKAISRKIIGGILSKYTFSIFYTPVMKTKLKSFSNPEKDFEEYLYLERHDLIYRYEKGLIESKIESVDNCIL